MEKISPQFPQRIRKMEEFSTGVYKFRMLGRPGDNILCGGAEYLWILGTSFHLYGAQNFEVAPRFFDNLCFNGSALYSDNNEKTFLIHKQTGRAAITANPVRRESRSTRLNQTHCAKMIGSVLALIIGAEYCYRFVSLHCLAAKKHNLSCNLIVFK
jgi:hypothetical protein